jgi:hypothetical protein
MNYHQAVERLRERVEVPLFAVEPWDTDLQAALREATPETLFRGRTVADPQAAAAVLAGLRIWNDDFTGAHNLAQGLKSVTGSYWHGICHRREGHRGEGVESNLANARYWFRQVGRHPAYDAVYRAALAALGGPGASTAGFRWRSEAQSLLEQRGGWDPVILVEWAGEITRGVLSPESQRLVEELQWREIACLVDWCAAQVLGE